MELAAHAAWVLRALADAGFEAVVVGGCVRDRLLGREPQDWDVATSALPHQTRRCLEVRGVRTLEVGQKYGTITALTPGGPVEVTTYRRDGDYADHRRPQQVTFTSRLEEDLSRRDFTMNAMAFSPKTGLVDRFGGRQDLAAGRVRCVGAADTRFAEDALRVLRGLRFAAQLGFALEQETAAAACRWAPTLGQVAGERLRQEWDKLVAAPAAGEVLARYGETFGQMARGCGLPLPGDWAALGRGLGALPARLELRLAWVLAGPEGDLDRAQAVLRRFRYDNRTRARVLALAQAAALGGLREGSRPALRLALAQLEPAWGEAVWQAGEELVLLRRTIYPGEDLSPVLAQVREQYPRFCWSPRQLCLGGRELAGLGAKPGPQMGQLLCHLCRACREERLENSPPALKEEAARWLAGFAEERRG